MAAFNHNLPFRPVRAGIAVLNPIVNKIGTIGCIATSDNQDRWIVSCYHVLGRIDLSAFNDGEPIFQPIDGLGPPVARNSLARSDSNLDCAAAAVENGVNVSPDILGLMPVTAIAEPQVGMRVLKSGSLTGVTEGVVTAIQGNNVEIGLLPGFPQTYELCGEGDSGAIWVSRADGVGVALHRAGTISGVRQAFGVRMSLVMKSLKLILVI